ncbi:MAG: amino acid permease [Candidatus Micrarchaeaceae archaeon]
MANPLLNEEKNVVEREQGLSKQLSSGQMLMISIGSAIGTGLFLGSGYAIGLAGPGVIISYIIGAFIAFTVMIALSEMAVQNPTAGSFGNYAETYLHRYMGFQVRWIYWFAQVIAIGGEMVAASIYMHFWFPSITPFIWMVIFSLILLTLNAISVKTFGTAEYWFTMIKVVVIIFFIIVGAFIIIYATHFGLKLAYLNYGGFFPKGIAGVWLATVVAIFSYIGVEVVAVTSGESKNPQKDVPRALRGMVLRLVLFYGLAIFIMVGMVPWTQAGVGESPFVKAFSLIGIPLAASIMNFVVLTAALSSSNTDIYLTSRMLFSLSRGHLGPKYFGKLSRFHVPFNALLISGVGIAFSIALDYYLGSTSAYLDIFGIAVFGGIFVWIMILLSHISFRRKYKKENLTVKYSVRGSVYFSIVGAILLTGVLISTLFTPGIQISIPSGIVALVVFTLLYIAYRKRNSKSAEEGVKS